MDQHPLFAKTDLSRGYYQFKMDSKRQKIIFFAGWSNLLIYCSTRTTNFTHQDILETCGCKLPASSFKCQLNSFYKTFTEGVFTRGLQIRFRFIVLTCDGVYQPRYP